jgi:hypothetical protein
LDGFMSRDVRPAILLCAIVSFLAAIGVRGDTGSRVLDLCTFLPGLDPAFARHLLLDGDREFHGYCEQAGPIAVRGAFAVLNSRLWYCAADSYLTTYRRVAPGLERLCEESAKLYDCPACIEGLKLRAAMGARGAELNRVMGDLVRLDRDVTTPIEDRVVQYRKLLGVFQQMHYEIGVMYAEDCLARMANLQGDSRQQIVLLHSVLARARRVGAEELVCQYLGQIGYERRMAGDVDSMLVCYRGGIAKADHHQFVEQSVRLRWFLADYYSGEGKFAAAASLANEAQRLCRRWGTALMEPRATLWSMDFFSTLGCWDIVRRYSDRMPVLLRAVDPLGHAQELTTFSLRARRLEARLLAEQGRPDEGADILSGVDSVLRKNSSPGVYGPFLTERADVLLRAGRMREVLAVATEGIAYADSFQLAETGFDLALARARARLALGDLVLARSELRDARARLASCRSVLAFMPCEFDGVEIGIDAACGARRAALGKFDRSLRELRATVRRMDAGPHSYLALAQAEDLRGIGQRLLEHSPSESCQLELEWQSLAGLMGTGDSIPPSRTVPEGNVLRSTQYPTIHVVYGFIDRQLTRWTCSREGTRCEVLPLTLNECDQLVGQVMHLLGSDPGAADAPLPDSLSKALSELGKLLLPPEIRDEHHARLVVSAQGAIARLPFEALDVSADSSYEPLLARHDVVYARPEPPVSRRTGDGTTVVLIGADEAEWESPGDTVPSAAKWEAQRAIARLPNARIVHGRDISKHALLDSWSRASILYVAAHLMRDPDAPLLCYFPMGFGARDRTDDAFLDLRDARTVDLSGCKLVVLSSCASGEPYVAGGRAGLSMADAFLDGGAAAAIHTRWRVREARAAIIAPDLAAAWLEGGHDPVAEWSDCRRTMLRGPRGWRHPFEWAAWSVTVRLPVRPWHAGSDKSTVASAVPESRGRARPKESAGPSGSPR